MSVLPKILGVHTVTKSRLFNIEGVDLLFSNGVKTTYERIAGGNGAVMVIPYLNYSLFDIGDIMCHILIYILLPLCLFALW